MITKFLSKLKSILFKTSESPETSLKKEVNSPKTKSKKVGSKKVSVKKVSAKKVSAKKVGSKKVGSKKACETLTKLPGVGSKSAKALYEAGFKTTKSIIAASEKDLLAVPGVGINLVNKLKKLK